VKNKIAEQVSKFSNLSFNKSYCHNEDVQTTLNKFWRMRGTIRRTMRQKY